MTHKEHSEGLKGIKRFLQEGLGEFDAKKIGETMDVAIEAVEKQIPKKPNRIEYVDGGAENECPSCKKRICMVFGNGDTFRWQMPYCCDCGQKLDWSEEE